MGTIDFVIKGNGLLSAQLAYYLRKTGKSVLLFSEQDFAGNVRNDHFRILESNQQLANYLFNISPNIFIPIKQLNFDAGKNSFKQISNFVMCKTKIKKEEYSNKKMLETYEPALNASDFKYGLLKKVYKFQYARLVMEYVLSAKQIGAEVYNYAKLSQKNDIFTLTQNNETKTFKAKNIINVSTNNNHITNYISIIPRYLLELRNSIKLKVNNANINFIPNFAAVIINHQEKIEQKDLIDLINKHFDKKLSENSIIENYTETYGNNIVKIENNNIYLNEQSIENNFNTIKNLLEKLNLETEIFDNKKLYYSFNFEANESVILDKVESGFREMEQLGLAATKYTQLYYRYGNKFLDLADIAFEYYQNIETRQTAWLRAEIDYSVKNEYTKNFNDFYYLRANLYFPNLFNNEIKKQAEDIFNKTVYLKLK